MYHPVLAYLRARIANGMQSGEDIDWAIRLMEQGRDFPDLSKRRVPMGPASECFKNARQLSDRANNRPVLRYVEGMASTLWQQPGMERPEPWLVRHAWCVDPDFQVIDPTWPSDFADRRYWGIVGG